MSFSLPFCTSLFLNISQGIFLWPLVVTQWGKGERKIHSGQFAKGNAGLMWEMGGGHPPLSPCHQWLYSALGAWGGSIHGIPFPCVCSPEGRATAECPWLHLFKPLCHLTLLILVYFFCWTKACNTSTVVCTKVQCKEELTAGLRLPPLAGLALGCDPWLASGNLAFELCPDADKAVLPIWGTESLLPF